MLVQKIKRKGGKHKSSIKVGPSNFDSTEGGSRNSKDDLINLNLVDSTHKPTGLHSSNDSNEESKEYKTSGPLKFNQVKIKESNLLFSDGFTFMDHLGGLKHQEVEMRKFKPSKINMSLERTSRLLSPQGFHTHTSKFEPPLELPEMITAAVQQKNVNFKSKLNKSK